MNLKFIKLTNCLGIEEKEINIGKVTLIDGKSRSGKTTIIDSIRKGLKNEDVRPKFVTGEGKGIVFMQFDEDLEVTRTIKGDNKSTVKVSQNGMSPSSPQTYLNDFFGSNDFAPIDWLKKKDKEQTEDLLKLLPITVTQEEITKLTGRSVSADYSKHGLVVCEELEKHFMDERKGVNADVKAYEINIQDAKTNLPPNYDAEAYRNVSLNELFAEISDIEAGNRKIKESQSIIDNANVIIESANQEYENRYEDMVEEFKRRKQELENKRKEKVDKATADAEEAKKFATKEIKDTAQLKENVAEIEKMKGYIVTADKLKVYEDELAKWSKEADKLTEIIKKIRNYPTELLTKTKSPIEGMGVANGVVTINGLPIKNLSDGEKMLLSIEVAKATAGKYKFILLNGLEQLDWTLQKELFAKMQADEFQYVVTRVADHELTISHIQDNQIINTETGEVLEIK